jgi:hypothetical protein
MVYVVSSGEINQEHQGAHSVLRSLGDAVALPIRHAYTSHSSTIEVMLWILRARHLYAS